MQPPPFGFGVYEPPASRRGRPAVILWYRTFAAVAALVYALFYFAWIGQWFGPSDPSASTFIGAVCAPLVLMHLIGAFVPFKPWGWTYAVVIICFGLLFWTFPFSIALLIYWANPTTKAAFGRM